MKLYSLCLGLLAVIIVISCNESSTQSEQTTSVKDSTVIIKKVHYDSSRENLQLSIADTITRSASYFFSNNKVKDLFVLKIASGMVKNSKAGLQIITAEGKVIYEQPFDAFALITGIYEPDTTPQLSGQAAYHAYVDSYWRSLTSKQFETYFKQSVDSFFTYIRPIDAAGLEDIYTWNEDEADKDFLNEISKVPTIRIMDIPCFDCDEGGYMIGYSRKQNKVVTLLVHD